MLAYSTYRALALALVVLLCQQQGASAWGESFGDKIFGGYGEGQSNGYSGTTQLVGYGQGSTADYIAAGGKVPTTPTTPTTPSGGGQGNGGSNNGGGSTTLGGTFTSVRGDFIAIILFSCQSWSFMAIHGQPVYLFVLVRSRSTSLGSRHGQGTHSRGAVSSTYACSKGHTIPRSRSQALEEHCSSVPPVHVAPVCCVSAVVQALVVHQSQISMQLH